MKDIEILAGAPTTTVREPDPLGGPASEHRIYPGARLGPFLEGSADLLVALINRVHGQGREIARAVPVGDVMAVVPAADGGCLLDVWTMMPSGVGPAGVAIVWVYYPPTGRAVQNIAATAVAGDRGKRPVVELTAADVAALGFDPHHPVEFRTLRVSKRALPEGYVDVTPRPNLPGRP